MLCLSRRGLIGLVVLRSRRIDPALPDGYPTIAPRLYPALPSFWVVHSPARRMVFSLVRPVA